MFQVVGTSTFNGNVSSTGLCLGGTCNASWPASGAISSSSALTSGYFPYWTNTAGGLNGTSTIFANSTGNVGIGTTNPAQGLNVNGNVQATAFYYSSDRSLKGNIQRLRNGFEHSSRAAGRHVRMEKGRLAWCGAYRAGRGEGVTRAGAHEQTRNQGHRVRQPTRAADRGGQGATERD